MKILHFILGRASLQTSNGVNKVINGLCKYCAREGNEVVVVGLSKSSKERFHIVQRDGFQVEVFNSFWNNCYKRLKEIITHVDIVHLHSINNNYNVVVANYLIKIGKPYVMTAHSGLCDDRFRHSGFLLKRIYHEMFQRRIYSKCSGIHAITREEITAISKYATNENIFFVSNGLDLEFPEIEDISILKLPRSNKVNDEIHCGYLGRLSAEKNIGGLIKAISILPEIYRHRLKCYFIGPDNTNEAKQLKQLTKELNLSNQIIFKGSLYGDDKYRMLKKLDFYIHPAFSDVVSIAVKEAMYCQLPSVITRTSDVAYYYNTDAFVMTEPEAKELSKGIIEMIDREMEWTIMGDNARSLVENTFNWAIVAPKMIKHYQELLNNEKTPSVLHT